MNITCKKSVGTKNSFSLSCSFSLKKSFGERVRKSKCSRRNLESLIMVHLYPEDLEHCPVSKVPFFGDGQFVEDLKVFGSGYTIFMHLAIFSAFALVSEINIDM